LLILIAFGALPGQCLPRLSFLKAAPHDVDVVAADSYRVLSHDAASSSCAAAAFSRLEDTCETIIRGENPAAKQRLAFDLANCHLLEATGVSWPCALDEPLASCTARMHASADFAAYTAYSIHIDNVCYHLAQQAFNRESAQAVDSLFSAAVATAADLQSLQSVAGATLDGLSGLEADLGRASATQRALLLSLDALRDAEETRFEQASLALSQLSSAATGIGRKTDSIAKAHTELAHAVAAGVDDLAARVDAASALQSVFAQQHSRELEGLAERASIAAAAAAALQTAVHSVAQEVQDHRGDFSGFAEESMRALRHVLSSAADLLEMGESSAEGQRRLLAAQTETLAGVLAAQHAAEAVSGTLVQLQDGLSGVLGDLATLREAQVTAAAALRISRDEAREAAQMLSAQHRELFDAQERVALVVAQVSDATRVLSGELFGLSAAAFYGVSILFLATVATAPPSTRAARLPVTCLAALAVMLERRAGVLQTMAASVVSVCSPDTVAPDAVPLLPPLIGSGVLALADALSRRSFVRRAYLALSGLSLLIAAHRHRRSLANPAFAAKAHLAALEAVRSDFSRVSAGLDANSRALDGLSVLLQPRIAAQFSSSTSAVPQCPSALPLSLSRRTHGFSGLPDPDVLLGPAKGRCTAGLPAGIQDPFCFTEAPYGHTGHASPHVAFAPEDSSSDSCHSALQPPCMLAVPGRWARLRARLRPGRRARLAAISNLPFDAGASYLDAEDSDSLYLPGSQDSSYSPSNTLSAPASLMDASDASDASVMTAVSPEVQAGLPA
jgi:hypothetical protein